MHYVFVLSSACACRGVFCVMTTIYLFKISNLLYILKWLKFLGMVVPSYYDPALLDTTLRRTEEE